MNWILLRLSWETYFIVNQAESRYSAEIYLLLGHISWLENFDREHMQQKLESKWYQTTSSAQLGLAQRSTALKFNLTQIRFAQKCQLREAQLSNSILIPIIFAQKSFDPLMIQNQGNLSLILSSQINFENGDVLDWGLVSWYWFG